MKVLSAQKMQSKSKPRPTVLARLVNERAGRGDDLRLPKRADGPQLLKARVKLLFERLGAMDVVGLAARAVGKLRLREPIVVHGNRGKLGKEVRWPTAQMDPRGRTTEPEHVSILCYA